MASASAHPRDVALAAYDAGTRALSVVVGRYGQAGESADVELRLRASPFEGRAVRVRGWHIGNVNAQPALLDAPAPLADETTRAAGGELVLVLRGLRDGDARVLRLGE